jgi:hypothetical protein
MNFHKACHIGVMMAMSVHATNCHRIQASTHPHRTVIPVAHRVYRERIMRLLYFDRPGTSKKHTANHEQGNRRNRCFQGTEEAAAKKAKPIPPGPYFEGDDLIS